MMRLALAALLLATAAQSQVAITCRWSPPTEGTTPVRYVLDLATDGGDWALADSVDAPDTSLVFDLDEGHYYQARVRAVDAQGNRGPYSEANLPLTVLTPPTIEVVDGVATITAAVPEAEVDRWVFQVQEDGTLRHLYIARDGTATVEVAGTPDSLQVQAQAFNGERTVGAGRRGRQAR